MAKLSEEEKRELLEAAHSEKLRKEFAALRNLSDERVLSPKEYVEFLDWSQQFMTEDPKDRSPIKGDIFLL
ncbi:MAG: hypothetical protein O7C75_21075 [Verrucomicrobia bacterium]|nr:hypothetical protein [Verrucomicrobiota bacterium]